MKPLQPVIATPEQLTVIDDASPGFWLIRGSAGSGKTTTALLRLKFLLQFWRERRASLGIVDPIRVLVLTYNRTLRGYIAELAASEIEDSDDVVLEVKTFGGWANDLASPVLLERAPMNAELLKLAARDFPWTSSFLLSEIEYLRGRFLPQNLDAYLTTERSGRGRVPRVDRSVRERLLEQVVEPYEAWKHENGLSDWNDVAAQLALEPPSVTYDIVVVDETQDFSANQIRAIANHVKEDFVCTFIRDTTQRIYDNAFSWRDANITIPPKQSRPLGVNYRNTKEIAAFALPLVTGIEQIGDESLPDLRKCRRTGAKPTVVKGKFNDQLDWAVNYLRNQVGAGETVGVLHRKGGGWFSEVRARLELEKIPYTSLTREVDWPDGPEQVALSTMHSAKGLEFDHVFILGYNKEIVEHGEDPDDWMLDAQRRLLAMAIGRARNSVVLGFKPSDASPVTDLLDPSTFDAIDV